MNSTNETHRLLFMKEAPPAAAKLGSSRLEHSRSARSRGIAPCAVGCPRKPEGADVLYVVPDAIFSGNRIPDLAAMAGLPSMSLEPRFAQLGGLISYGPDYLAVSRLESPLCRSNFERRQTGRPADGAIRQVHAHHRSRRTAGSARRENSLVPSRTLRTRRSNEIASLLRCMSPKMADFVANVG